MYHINKVIFIFYENVFSFSLCQYGYEEKWTYTVYVYWDLDGYMKLTRKQN